MKYLLMLAALLASIHAHAADEVRLLRSQSNVAQNNGLSLQTARFEVLVKNLAYAKQVYVHLKKPDDSWIDVPLAYQRTADSGREVWAGSFIDTGIAGPTFNTWDLEFAVRYTVNGQSYWDNNGGQNYRQAKDSGSIVYGGYAVLNRLYDANNPAYVSSSQIVGAVTLRNLASSKQVKVVYTTDGWATQKTAWATFSSTYWLDGYSAAPNPNGYGFEEWTYVLDAGTQAGQLEYAIAYLVNGQTYWDNNFGRNYTMTLRQH